MEKACIIVGAGSFTGMSILPKKGDLIIAADGGYRYLEELGLMPDVLLGDFDSLDLVPEHKNLIRHSPIKDDTDMALAVEYGKMQGYRRFFLYGGLGGRMDHSMANLQLLTGISRDGMEGYLIGEGSMITAVTAGVQPAAIQFSEDARGYLSVFAAGDTARGVTETGFKYTTDHMDFHCDRALGVSNEFTGSPSSITVEQGTLLVLWDEKNGLPAFRSEWQ